MPTDSQLEMLLLTGVVVAGKIARIQQDKLNDLMLRLREWAITTNNWVNGGTPLELIRTANRAQCLLPALQAVKLGQYKKTLKAFVTLAESGLNLRECSRDDLCSVPGIGLKTASFFILFTRPGVRIACLDVHILNHLRENGFPDAPRTTPPGKQYLHWEGIFLTLCDSLKRNPAELDFEIWLARNRGDQIKYVTQIKA